MWKLLSRRDGQRRRRWPYVMLAVGLAWLLIPPSGRAIEVAYPPPMADGPEVALGTNKPDLAVVEVWDKAEAAWGAMTRFEQSRIATVIENPVVTGSYAVGLQGRIEHLMRRHSDRRRMLHGMAVHYSVTRDQFADGNALCWQWWVKLRHDSRREDWDLTVFDGEQGWRLAQRVGEGDGLESRIVRDAPNPRVEDDAWPVRSIYERLRTVPSRLAGTETIDGLTCLRLEFDELWGDGKCPVRTTYWICPDRGYREVRVENVMGGLSQPTSFGTVVGNQTIQRNTGFVQRGGAWYPVSGITDRWLLMEGGEPVFNMRVAWATHELVVGDEVEAPSLWRPLDPPGARRYLADGQDHDGRDDYQALEQTLRRGDWEAVPGELARLGTP